MKDNSPLINKRHLAGGCAGGPAEHLAEGELAALRGRDPFCWAQRGGEKFRSENRGMGLRTKLGAATSGWSGIGVGMEADLAAIASRAERHASEPRYRAEDLAYEAWEAAGPRRAVLARRALALWPDCADGYVLLAQAASSLEEARELLERGVAAGERVVGRRVFVEEGRR